MSEPHVGTSAGGEFASRHIGLRPDDVTAMLKRLGFSSLGDLVDAAVPAEIRIDEPIVLDGIDRPLTETEATAAMRWLANANTPVHSLIGLGYYGTLTPAVIRRSVLENPSWYTAYTPYQPEISQGRLEALLNYQTMVCDLVGMEIANSSLLCEGTAAAEAMAMARRITRSGPDRFFVDADCHPQVIDVIATRAAPLGIELVIGDTDADLQPAEVYGALLAYPGSSGAIRNLQPVIEALHGTGAIAAVTADLLACCVLQPPGEQGADIVVGSSQRFGVPLGFGGPHAAFLATSEQHRRSMPGRLVGVSVDAAGRPAYRLALQTREQHIRRERATSNICTAQVLLAVMASMYAVWHGPEGLAEIAGRVQRLTAALAAGLRSIGSDGMPRGALGGTSGGLSVRNDTFFDTLTVEVPGAADAVVDAARTAGFNLRRVDADTVSVSLDETCDEATVAHLLDAFGALPDGRTLDVSTVAELAASAPSGIAGELARTSEYLTHPTFHSYRSETEMMRYLRRLASADVALDRSMIPLGSCTMKLNAAAEMTPVTWPQFADVHPFAPPDQWEGYRQIIADLERWLAEVTGYDAVSLQPNAGSQGELAGLLAIRGYHDDRGDAHRTVCLIPSSAHGTNAASAVMAGMRVVVVGCTDDGDVDLDDLDAKIAEHGDQLAAFMATYPSTHGVYEDGIRQVCLKVHEAGGQVYVDGANLNALVGLAAPGTFGADVSHLNLHKTFCIPHGGGGPGIGPVACRLHLAKYLPNHPLVPTAGPDTGPGAISSAPWGSAGILPIPWMYIAMMGVEGLTQATQTAILSANYLASRLGEHFPILYQGRYGLVAHECIVDLRPFSDWASVDDVAKRLIDFGFHAPTMSFPVAGTLMIEPTESESLAEIDRFCDAMATIRYEIDKIASGEWPADDNPLVNAPHTAVDVLTGEWDHPYSRTEAAYPAGTDVATLVADKYWPPVSRIDGAYGDRNLMCACPDPRAFETS
ncbi:aminomethyl-transferring glycine dehydrogenase [Candidatus Poriferisodalis sp.]|uniref:aminomethyl-transferring glycine dehydrogenase n=1 Tax=Candidatus Poriferisodalis sp. TaxID=3101277 RepID=UPI003B0210DB